MKRLLIAAVAVAAFAVVPSSASAWGPQECADWYAEHGSNHPDCGGYVPPPPPVHHITVCLNGEQVTVPDNQVPAGATEGECQPVVPPPNQPEAPVPGPTPPTPETPDTDYVPPPVQVDTPPEDNGGEGHVGTPIREVAGKEQGPENTPEAAPKVQVQDESILPYTGLQVLLVFGLGVVALAGGLVLRRRAA